MTPRRRHQPTFLDYLVIAISPALIMLLVGSLVFFLLTAFYHGQFESRLRYVAALFVLATVLIGRISIEDGSHYAAAFALPLAIATWLALTQFTDAGGLIIMLIIAVTWWSAHQLTWDCTVLDESQEASGTGLIDAAGWGESRDAAEERVAIPSRLSVGDPSTRTSWKSWWQRWQANRQRPHPPGLRLLYFAVLSLPLFAMGQWAIGSDNVAATHSAFRCLVVYCGSFLSLMGTTSFLSIRRYLCQRQIEMPSEMAKNWSLFAAATIGAILLVSCLLPRPSPQPFRLLGWSNRTQQANRLAVTSVDAVESDLPAAAQNSDTNMSQSADTEGSGDASPQESSERGTSESPSAGHSPPMAPSERELRGEPNEHDSATSSDHDSASETQRPADGESAEGGEMAETGPSRVPSETTGEGDRVTSQAANSRPPDSREKSAAGDSSTETELPQLEPSPAGEPNQRTTAEDSRTRASTAGRMRDWLSAWGPMWREVLRWLRVATIVSITAYLIWRYAAVIGAAVMNWLRAVWEWWRGRSDRPTATFDEPDALVERGPPFASFRNPFQSGNQLADAALIDYSFRALEAWAGERAVPRSAAATPDEFSTSLRQSAPHLAAHAVILIKQYDCLVYGGQIRIDRDIRESVRRLWHAMQA